LPTTERGAGFAFEWSFRCWSPRAPEPAAVFGVTRSS
jgi:hypothetical protein